MHRLVRKVGYDFGCSDGTYGTYLILKNIPIADDTENGVIPIGLTHPISDEQKKRLGRDASEENQLIYVDYAPKPSLVIQQARHFGKVTVCDHHDTSMKPYNGLCIPEELRDKIILKFDNTRCGSEIVWDELIKPRFPNLKRPLLLDYIRMADLGLKDNEAYRARFNDDEDYYFKIVSCIDSHIPCNHFEKALLAIDQFQARFTSDEFVMKEGAQLYPKLLHEAHEIWQNACCTPLDLPGIGPNWVPIVHKDIRKNARFVSDVAKDYAQQDPHKHPQHKANKSGITLIWCKRDDGIVYLSVRTNGSPHAGDVAEFVGKTVFNVEGKSIKGKSGGGREDYACAQFTPEIFRMLFPVFAMGEKVKYGSPLRYAAIRQDNVVRTTDNHLLTLTNTCQPFLQTSPYFGQTNAKLTSLAL